MSERKPGPGWIKNRRGAWEPGPQAALGMSRDEFGSWYGKENPGWEQQVYEDFAQNYQQDPKRYDYSLAYANALQRYGLDHEEGVEVARILAQTANRGGAVMPESIENRRMAVLPLSSPVKVVAPQQQSATGSQLNIPAAQEQKQAVAALEQAQTPVGESGMRYAMKYGLPALGVLLGAYGLGAMASGGRGDDATVVRG